jgi:hypothetical protein
MLAQSVMQLGLDTESQIKVAFYRVLCREPNAKELNRLLDAYNKQRTNFGANPKDASDLVRIGNATRNESLPEVDHAAMTTLCLAIFNLDEALTRE